MQASEFCYWLQGFFELRNKSTTESISAVQASIIEKHLRLVFAHDLDTAHGDAEVQQKLNSIHDQPVPGTTTMRC